MVWEWSKGHKRWPVEQTYQYIEIGRCAREGPEDREDEPTQEVALDPEDPGRTVKVGANLSVHVKTALIALLRNYKDVFAWSHEDMLGVDPKVISHHLSTDPEFRPVVQKRKLFNPERSVAIKKEVEKLLSAWVDKGSQVSGVGGQCGVGQEKEQAMEDVCRLYRLEQSLPKR
ncbi:hypothetical protein LWI29_023956 [Acer saccharum]|uniref:Uncharacterized protein n=1 Tax=Acer saccharum TaxID=4024 RepID=A0AA39RE23_ACESA|nr:hypothetical protein LWI29_023956 [Acer saccharum]